MATWHSDTPEMDQQVSTAIQNIEDNFKELKDILEAITTGTLGVTEPASFAVDAFLGTYFAMAEATNADFDTGTTTVDSVAHASYRACIWFYALNNGGTNRRAGLFMACWASGGGTIVGSDMLSTGDIGDTTGVTLDADVSGVDVRLRATATSDNWSIQLLRLAAVA